MTSLTESDLQQQLAKLGELRAAIGQAIVGQQDVVEQLLIGLLAGGHCLLEGVPGLGKTLLVRSLGEALHLQFRRVQFTPDLMPSDILGTELLEEDHGTGHRHFRFQPGPIFTNLLLADELNRTPPKTQAALLEAMQERTVSYAGTTHALPSPFFVLATQNPLELRKVSTLRSAGLIATSTSSLASSAMIATVAAEVWMRPCDSVAGTRCTRWVPDSYLSRA